MRTGSITINGNACTITYPNELAFIFSQQLVTISGAVGEFEAVFAIRRYLDGAVEFNPISEVRQSYKGKVTMDVSRLLQLVAFQDVDLTGTVYDYTQDSRKGLTGKFDLIVTVAGQTFTAQIYGVYGALDLDEGYGADERRKFWPEFPYTIPVSAKCQNFNRAAGVQTNRRQLTQPQDYGINDFDLYKMYEDYAPIKTEVEAGNDLFLLLEGHETLRNGKQSSRSKVFTLTPGCGSINDQSRIYLRWIGRRGELCYYLFKKISETLTSEAEEFRRYYDLDLQVYHDGVGYNPVRANYEQTRVMEIAAVGAADYEIDLLESLIASPLVEKMNGTSRNYPTWSRVAVSATSIKRDRRRQTGRLQDIPLTIVLPERNSITI